MTRPRLINISIDTMYSVWKFEAGNTRAPKVKSATEHAQQERDRLTRTTELVQTFATQAVKELPPLTASEVLSALFRQRGVPSLDSFTVMLVGLFRMSLGFSNLVEGHERKFMPITRWETRNAVITVWTIEPVVSSTVIRGNSINVRLANDIFSEDIEWIEPMSMTTHSTTVRPGNEIRGRWAGWIVWKAATELYNMETTDSVCSTCNLSSTLFGFSTQTTTADLVHLAMTPETIAMIATHSEMIAASMGVSVIMTTHGSTKLSIRPSVSVNRNSSLRLFGNGSMQFCGSPNDIEVTVSAAVRLIKRTMEANTDGFLSTMRQMKSPIA